MTAAGQGDILAPMTAERPPDLDPKRHALFLDFDGTFVDFAPERDAIALRPGSRELLQALHDRMDGALALISGRQIANLDMHLQPLKLPAAGVHGHEIRAGGQLRLSADSDMMRTARERLSAAIPAGDPLQIEDKGAALVVHFRKAPDQAGRAERLAREAAAGLADIEIMRGNAIVELRLKGRDKGLAIGELMRLAPYSGRVPIFVGDDTTDEDGFAKVQEAGGVGIKVGEGKTRAECRLADISAVHDWLRAALKL